MPRVMGTLECQTVVRPHVVQYTPLHSVTWEFQPQILIDLSTPHYFIQYLLYHLSRYDNMLLSSPNFTAGAFTSLASSSAPTNPREISLPPRHPGTLVIIVQLI